MKKKIIIAFILLSVGIFADGELGTNVDKNQYILNKMKQDNQQLKDEVERLSAILYGLETKFTKNIKFEKAEVYLTRDIDSFTVKIVTDNLGYGKYNDILDNFINLIKYEPKDSAIDTITFIGNENNVEFLNSYFLHRGISSDRLKLEVENQEEKYDEGYESANFMEPKENIAKTPIETKIILKINK